jgi:hypothetical protein
VDVAGEKGKECLGEDISEGQTGRRFRVKGVLCNEESIELVCKVSSIVCAEQEDERKVFFLQHTVKLFNNLRKCFSDRRVVIRNISHQGHPQPTVDISRSFQEGQVT